MKTIIKSWRFWVIALLALTTLACAGRAERRERKEEAREERRERAEQRRAERAEKAEQRRASGEPAPMTAAERREAARQQRAERRQASREKPQATPVEQAESPAVQTAAAPATQRVATAPAAAADDGSSKIVFMRVSKQSSGANASLFDVTEAGAPRFIGNVNAGAKISYPLNPGIYTFMVVGETAEFMQATIVGGKTYYALVIPRSGAKRFAIEPVRRNEIGGKEFTTWDRGTKLMTDAGTAQGFNAAEVSEKRNRYWQDWSKKAAGERAELTINAEDGR